MTKPRETDLYAPIKSYLEGQGYEVKGEIGAVDIMAMRAQDPPILIELKLNFSLALVHQGIARQAITDAVYLAVPHGLKSMKSNIALCRRLGLGIMSVRLRDNFVEILVDPGPYNPRKSAKRKTRLLREFARRVGDPNQGGATRKGLITSYRQDALKIATYLSDNGPTKGAIIAKSINVPKATTIMAADHYNWFNRIKIGTYALTPKGKKELDTYGRIKVISANIG